MSSRHPFHKKRRGGGYRKGGGGGGYRRGGNNPFGRKQDYKKSLSALEERVAKEDALDESFGYHPFTQGPERLGFLLNMQATLLTDAESGVSKSAIAYYFLSNDGSSFKVTIPYEPYFYIWVKPKHFGEVEEHLRRTYQQHIVSIAAVDKEDLGLNNHLTGLRRRYMKISFLTVQALLAVRSQLKPHVEKNQARLGVYTFEGMHQSSAFDDPTGAVTDYILDIREYDVPYYMRSAIDNGVRCGVWYKVIAVSGTISLKEQDIAFRPEPKICAFDIETTHAPLRFPDATTDCITMISYMLDEQGYLIVNRDIVVEDVADFEYTPKPEYQGPFRVFNERNEAALLERFFSHMTTHRPHIYVTYNGDNFDWPFIAARARIHGMSVESRLGFQMRGDEVKCKHSSHLDAFRWVVRDSYLPVGSQGLKAVTKAKLGYDPLELDPEEMVRFTVEAPQRLASYSVSDAVATYYLFKKYVEPFIFSLCNLIPMNPDDVLRKGSGTLCEALLCVQATHANVIYPNKKQQTFGQHYKGHLLESETYVGGHVESLAAGVYRSDIPHSFELDSDQFQSMLDELDGLLDFCVRKEAEWDPSDVTNLDEVRQQLSAPLVNLRDNPTRMEKGPIYHLDVGAMYPNIILTNRLQPSAIVSPVTCAACDFNRPSNKCQRRMEWTWRGDFFPTTRGDEEAIRTQLQTERFPTTDDPSQVRPYHKLSKADQMLKLKERLKEFSRRTYGKTHQVVSELRTDTVCMRENPFYVDTVRQFRDRRYTYKAKHKQWGAKLRAAKAENREMDMKEAEGMVTVFDSLQLAHKCILNSFYGYVMRRGSRWFSMEMAGIVTLTGARIIQETRVIVERIGKALELDTDGIWCILPDTLPSDFTLKHKDGKERSFNYSCILLNFMVSKLFSNHQYQDWDSKTHEWKIKSENSIFFEVDGPYRAMILPSSTEQGKRLKKRYAVFHPNGKLAEIKGFELKRRGELKLIKIFQKQIFSAPSPFLQGDTLQQCYEVVSRDANHWLDVLLSHGKGMKEDELLDLLSSSTSMSKALAEYGNSRSCAITTAKRLGAFLGAQMIAEKGLTCRYIVSRFPGGASVADRAVPTQIFRAEPKVREFFLRKWCGSSRGISVDLANILDWDYYINRFASVVLKIISIPAFYQMVRNPVPRVPYPDWLAKLQAQRDDPHKQVRIDTMFTVKPRPAVMPAMMRDIEETAGAPTSGASAPVARVVRPSRERKDDVASADSPDDEPMPDRDRKPKKWMRWAKRKWRQLEAARKAQAGSMHPGVGPSAARRRGIKAGKITLADDFVVTSYTQKRRYSLAAHPWHIVQITDVGMPLGMFKVWALMNGALQSVRLLVPRTFYINTSKQRDDLKPVVRTLPRRRPVIHLYEVELEEAQYQREQKEWATRFTHPSVEGVYETHMPLLFKAIMELGAVATVRRSTLSEDGPYDLFSLAQLQRRPSSGVTRGGGTQRRSGANVGGDDSVYLEGMHPDDGASAPPLSAAALYHVCNEARTMALYCLWLPAPVQRMVVYVVDAARGRTAATVNMSDYVHTKMGSSVTVVWKRVTRPDLAQAAVEKELGAYLAQGHGPSVLYVRSPLDAKALAQHVPATQDVPVVRIAADASALSKPSENWVRHCLRRALQTVKGMMVWVADQMCACRYFDVPLGNLNPHADPLLPLDVMYSRLLRENGHILWTSESARPDLGGAEADDPLFAEERTNPEFMAPGCYDTVCIELNLQEVPLVAIIATKTDEEMMSIMSDAPRQADGPGGLASAHPHTSQAQPELDAELRTLREVMRTHAAAADCSDAFKLLVVAVDKLANDREVQGLHSHVVDVTLTNLYHWISNQQSRMYDPALHQLVHSRMQKLLVKVLSELRRLGAKVVHANLHRVIIATAKRSRLDAKAYWDYISAYMAEQAECAEVWSLLEIEPTKNGFIDVLLFMDSANRADYIAQREADTIGEPEPLPISANWNIADFFPNTVKKEFLSVISEFLLNLYALNHPDASHPLSQARQPLGPDRNEIDGLSDSVPGLRQRLLYSGSGGAEEVGATTSSASASTSKWSLAARSVDNGDSDDEDSGNDDDGDGDNVTVVPHTPGGVITKTHVPRANRTKRRYAAALRELVGSSLTQRLLQIVQNIRSTVALGGSGKAFLRGSSSDGATSAVAATPLPPTPDHIDVDRPELLFVTALCHVLGLDRRLETEVGRLRTTLLKAINVRPFADEAEFHNPTHSYVLTDVSCPNCSGLREVDLLRDPDVLKGNWRCQRPMCGAPLDHSAVESALVDVVHRKVYNMVTQDLKCARCGLVKAENLAATCPECSGYFDMTQSSSDFADTLSIFKRIAEFHRLPWLLEVTTGYESSV